MYLRMTIRLKVSSCYPTIIRSRLAFTQFNAPLPPPPPAMFALCIINVLPASSGSDGVLNASSLFLDHSRPSSRKMAE